MKAVDGEVGGFPCGLPQVETIRQKLAEKAEKGTKAKKGAKR